MPDTKIIEQDGKRYEFTPGQGGGLVVRGEFKKGPLIEEHAQIAKSMIDPRLTENAHDTKMVAKKHPTYGDGYTTVAGDVDESR